MEKNSNLKPISSTKKYKRDWWQRSRKTFKGYSMTVYSKQKSVSKRRNMNPPEYSLQEFQDWLRGQDVFWELFNKWKETGDRKIAPSVDRKNHEKSYILDNLQIITLWDNLYIKGFRERADAIRTWQKSKEGQKHLNDFGRRGHAKIREMCLKREIVCVFCGKLFKSQSLLSKYCSSSCGKKYRRQHQ